MVEELTQEQKQARFVQQLEEIDKLFEDAREWADLSKCLNKIKQAIEKHPNQHVPMKKMLAKRLAQCLNPDLGVIHIITIEVYSLIFERESDLAVGNNEQLWDNCLGAFYSGLFGFYQYAQFEVKQAFLILVHDYILKLEKDLLISLPGFLCCMLPAMEDQNNELKDKLGQILADTEKIVGTSIFIGECWKTILRTPRTRLSGLKFLDTLIPKDFNSASKRAKEGRVYISPLRQVIIGGIMSIEKHDLGSTTKPQWIEVQEGKIAKMANGGDIKEEVVAFYYPKKTQLVTNALLKCLSLQGNSIYINRAAFDFLSSHLVITGTLNEMEENIRLCEFGLISTRNRDMAAQRKFFTWFASTIDEESSQQVDQDNLSVQIFIPAMRRIFLRFRNVQTKSLSGFVNFNSSSGDRLDHLTPIEILALVFSARPQLIHTVFDQLAIDLVEYLQFTFTKDIHGSESKLEEYQRDVLEQMHMVKDILHHSICKNIQKKLVEQIENLKTSNPKHSRDYKIDILSMISFYLKQIYKKEQDQIAPDASTPTEKGSKGGMRISKSENEAINYFAKNLVPILAQLINSVEVLSSNLKHLEYTVPVLDLIQQLLQMLEARDIEYDKETQVLRDAIQKFNDFFTKLCETYLHDETDLENNALRLKAYRQISMVLVQIQVYIDPDTVTSIPQWLKTVINCATGAVEKKTMLITSIQIIQNIIEVFEEDQNTAHPMIKKLSNQILKSNEDLEANQKIINTLWSLMDEPGEHFNVVQQLKNFDAYMPTAFNNVIVDQLKHKDKEVRFRAVKKFSIFWRLTANDKSYVPFLTQDERKMKGELSKDSFEELFGNVPKNKEDKTSRSQMPIHAMLEILEDPDPQLRMACRSWLQDSRNDFGRILDPLIAEFLSNAEFFRSRTGQLFFCGSFDTTLIIENFKKLLSIIQICQEDFVLYCQETEMPEEIRKKFEKCYNMIAIDGDVQPVLTHDKYIEAIIYITLPFIMGQAVESMCSHTDYLAINSVTAHACEFLEVVLRELNVSPEVSLEVNHILIQILVKIFRQSIDNDNTQLQLNLLSIFKAIIHKSNFYSAALKYDVENGKDEDEGHHQKQAQLKSAHDLFEQNTFLLCMADGLQNQDGFVRKHYIKFCQKLVPTMIKILRPVAAARLIKIILRAFCRLMFMIDASTRQKQQTTQGTLAKFMIKQLSSQLSGTFPTNGATPGQDDPESVYQNLPEKSIKNDNEIITIITGFKVILKSLMKFDEPDVYIEVTPGEERKTTVNDVVQQNGWFSWYYEQPDIEVDELYPKKKFDKIQLSCFEEVQAVLLGCLNCWNDLDVFRLEKREQHFSRLGVFPYHPRDSDLMREKIASQGGLEDTLKVIQENELRVSSISGEEVEVLLNTDVKKIGAYDRHSAPDKLGKKSPKKDLLGGGGKSKKTAADLRKKFGMAYATTVTLKVNKLIKEREVGGKKQKALTREDYMKSHFNTIQGSVIGFLEPMASKFSYQIVHGYLELWKARSNMTKIGINTNEGSEKIVQMLLSLQIEPHEVLYSINEWMHGNDYIVRETEAPVTLDREEKSKATLQSLICHMVYTYLALCIAPNFPHQTAKEQKDAFANAKKEGYVDQAQESSIKLNANAMKFMRNLIHTKSPNTICWLLEILLLITTKFKAQTNEQLERRFKSEQAKMLDQLLESSNAVLNDKASVQYTDEFGIKDICLSPTVYEFFRRFEWNKQKNTKIEQITPLTAMNRLGKSLKDVNVNLTFTAQQLAEISEIPLQKDSMFEDMAIVRDPDVINQCGDLSNFMLNVNKNLHGMINLDSQSQKIIFKTLLTVTLRQNLIQLSTHIYTIDEKAKKEQSESIIVDAAFKILEKHMKNMDASTEEIVFSEFLSDLLAHLSIKSSTIHDQFPQSVADLFNNQRFFLMNDRILRKWQIIMRQFLHHNVAIFEDLLYKLNLDVSNEAWMGEIKAITFKKVGFLAYSCKVDSFDAQIEQLLKTMTLGFKIKNKDREIRMQLFLLSRIIMLRLTDTQLVEALRKLWPHLLAELVSVFDDSHTISGKLGSHTECDVWLIAEATKVIELMSELNIEDFQMNQWMFMFDGYGLNSERSIAEDMLLPKKYSSNVQGAPLQRNDSLNFQPYMVKFMCNKGSYEGTETVSYVVKEAFETSDKEFLVYDALSEELPTETDFSTVVPLQTRPQAFKIDKNNDPFEDFQGNEEQKKYAADEQQLFKYVTSLQQLLADSNVKMMKMDVATQNSSLEIDVQNMSNSEGKK